MARSPRINVSLDQDLRDRLSHAARVAKRSESNLIAVLIAEWLDEHAPNRADEDAQPYAIPGPKRPRQKIKPAPDATASGDTARASSARKGIPRLQHEPALAPAEPRRRQTRA